MSKMTREAWHLIAVAILEWNKTHTPAPEVLEEIQRQALEDCPELLGEI